MQEIVFTLDGKDYRLDGEINFGDAVFLRKVGVPVPVLAGAMADMNLAALTDPSIMGPLLLIAMRHAGEDPAPDMLDKRPITDLEIRVDGEPEDDPPPSAVDAPNAPTASGTSETTPDSSGAPTSSSSSQP